MSLNLDLSGVKEQSFGALPEGDYSLVSDDAEVKETKSGQGQYIKVKFRVFEGPAEGRFIFHNFNIRNENAKAQTIGLGQLKSFMKAAAMKEVDKLDDVKSLVGYKVTAKLKVTEDKGYGEGNNITSFKAYKEQAQTEAKQGQPF